MRDFQHFLQMLPTYTEFALFQRPILTIRGEKYFVATVQDALAAKKQFDLIVETTKTGTDKRVLDFYHNFVQHHKDGATFEVILTHKFEVGKEVTAPNEYVARRFLNRLEEIGWVTIRENEQLDKRKLTFYALKDPSEDEDVKAQTKISESRCKSETQPDLKALLEKDFETWLKTSSNTGNCLQLTTLCFSSNNEKPLDLEHFKKIILGVEGFQLLLVPNEDIELSSEIIRENKCNGKMHPDSLFSTGKPTFRYRKIPQAKRCDFCRGLNVEYEVLTPDGATQRKCDPCFKKLYNMFKDGATFIQEEIS